MTYSRYVAVEPHRGVFVKRLSAKATPVKLTAARALVVSASQAHTVAFDLPLHCFGLVVPRARLSGPMRPCQKMAEAGAPDELCSLARA
jgi:hypothetical protein